MFILTALVYPVVLAVLCVGAGLLVDRASGRFLPGALLPAVGAAALIGASQLTTYAWPLAPGTPYVMVALAIAGFAFAWHRVRALARRWRAWAWQIVALVLAYVLALAPVLFAGRPTFSSYMVLTDSAFHLIGADFLMRHGQDYAHLDLRNSYGQFINAHYNSSYPSGSDTLFGGSAFVLRLPLIWAFQPFNAFMLATAAGPAWLLLRRMGLDGGWAALAALSAIVPALVYGYELVGAIKEITALPMILTLGVLVVLHPRWLRGPPTGAIPFALVAAAGISALGIGFGTWVLAAAAVLVVVVIGDVLAGRQSARQSLLLVGAGAIVALVSAWPTWINFSGSLQAAQNIASTANPGNLSTPLRAVQVFGTWLSASYQIVPAGGDLRAHPRAHRDHTVRLPGGRRARHPQPAVPAGRLAHADACGVARVYPVRHHLGGGQDPHAHLTRARAAGVGRRGRPASFAAAAGVPASPRRCWRSRSPAGWRPRMPCSTTAPTSPPPRATTSWPR